MIYAPLRTVAAVRFTEERIYRRGYHQGFLEAVRAFADGMTFAEAEALELEIASWRESPPFPRQPPTHHHRP